MQAVENILLTRVSCFFLEFTPKGANKGAKPRAPSSRLYLELASRSRLHALELYDYLLTNRNNLCILITISIILKPAFIQQEFKFQTIQ